MTSPITQRMRLRALLILTCLVSCVAASTAAAQLASAAGAPLRQGSGYRLAGGDFVGYYLTSTGAKVYCLSPRKALPASVSMTSVGRLPGVSATVSRRLTYALARWGNPSTRNQAAAESQLLNTIVGNRADVKRRAAALPRYLAKVVAHRLLLTERLAGPYRVEVHLPTALLPGQSAIGTARVVSVSGHAVPGARVALTASANAAVQPSVRAGAAGVARFRYRAADIGTVRIRAVATQLPRDAVRTNHPSASEQRMVGTAGTASASGSATFHGTPRGFTGSYSCSTACDGAPVVTLRACAEHSFRARRMVWHAGRHVVVLNFRPSKGVSCRSTSVQLADRDRVRGEWQFRTSHGWSKGVPAKGSFVVDCPPVPGVAVSMSYDCTNASLTIALAAANGTSHREVLVVGGAADRRIVADRGQQAVFTTRVSCSHPTTYTTQAGVQRAGGGYHYGAVASVTTPHQ